MPGVATIRQPSSPATIAIGGRRIPARVALFWAGVTFWMSLMLIDTHSAGLVALLASFGFIVEMIVVTSATRTVRLSLVARFYCWGGAMMSAVWLIDYAFTMVEPNGNALSRKLFTPFLEESLKLAPVAFYLWRQRRAQSRSLGASDVLLLTAASGAGFGLVEDASIQHSFGTWHPVWWLPTTAVSGASITVGHQIWASIAGATLGLALLWRLREPLSNLLGVSGLLWSMLDHFRNNLAVGRSGFFVNFLNFIGGNGWVSVYLFVLSVIAVVGSDLFAVRKMLSSRPQLKFKEGKAAGISRQGDGLKGLWAFLVERRAFAYVLFRSQRLKGPTREELTRLAAVLERRLNKQGLLVITQKANP
jgi:RsiW-degrading membrane proteinase PrsW (M82 family)